MLIAKSRGPSGVLTAVLLALSAVGIAGCAGDLGYAKKAAKNAAAFVGDMQQTTNDAIQKQRSQQQAALKNAAGLSVAAEVNLASTNRHVVTWEADKSEDSQKLLDAMLKLTGDDALTKSAPFILMTPLPEFNSPAIDDKSFSSVIATLNKLSKGPSPMERANALIPYIQVLSKAYKDSAGGTVAKAPSGGSVVGVVATQAQAAEARSLFGPATPPAAVPSPANAAPAAMMLAPSGPTEIPGPSSAGPDNAGLVDGLMRAMQ